MRIAILAVTKKGCDLAEKISEGIGGKIFIKGRDFEQMKIFVEEIFTKFDALLIAAYRFYVKRLKVVEF